MYDNNNEQLWRLLLTFINNSSVIPIIGPELLKINLEGETILLYDYLAKQLANKLNIDFKPTDSLSAVAERYISQSNGNGREYIYAELMGVMPLLTKDKMPEALVKLAKIRSIKLFVTTSFDPLLVQTLNQVRYGGLDKVQVLTFSPNSINDLPKGFDQLDNTIVFHLFGKLSAMPAYAVTDEDVLEFMHTLQSKISRPDRLFDALITQNLMIIGCPLSDWLGRFFVRIGKKERLISSIDKIDFMAGDQLLNEKNLGEFLQCFSNRTKIIPLKSIEFVNELYRRWEALQPEVKPIEETNYTFKRDSDSKGRGAVFLSYASEDRHAVVEIHDALAIEGIDVWFDQNDLTSGDKYDPKIKNNIDHCSLFVPILSQNALNGGYRYLYSEWDHAIERARGYLEYEEFILPVIIDNTSPKFEKIPTKFRNELTIESIYDAESRARFVKKVKQCYRNKQRFLAQLA